MRDGSYVSYRLHSQTDTLKGANRSLASGTWPLDKNIHLPYAVVQRLLGGALSGQLRSVGRALARALKPGRAGAGPCHSVTLLVRERYDRIVERRLNIRSRVRDVLAWSPARCATPSSSCHTSPPLLYYFFDRERLRPGTVFFGPFRVRALVRVR